MSLTTQTALSGNQRRLITLFKQFVERAILPTLRNNDSVMSEWQYFSTLLGGDSVDIGKLQIYVDVLGGTRSYEDKKEQDKPKVGGFYRKKDEVGIAPTTGFEPAQVSTAEPTQPVFSFNPSKTFGGERSKLGIFPLKRADDFTVPSVGIASKSNQQPLEIGKANQPTMDMEYARKEERRPNIQKFINAFEVLHKQFQQNQQKMEQSTGYSVAPSYQPYKFEDKKYI